MRSCLSPPGLKSYSYRCKLRASRCLSTNSMHIRIRPFVLVLWGILFYFDNLVGQSECELICSRTSCFGYCAVAGNSAMATKQNLVPCTCPFCNGKAVSKYVRHQHSQKYGHCSTEFQQILEESTLQSSSTGTDPPLASVPSDSDDFNPVGSPEVCEYDTFCDMVCYC